MEDLMARALDQATNGGAAYADVRVSQSAEQIISLKNGLVEDLEYNESIGIGVRVLVNGRWGFASTSSLNAAEVERITRLALEIGRASMAAPGRGVELGPAVTHRGAYQTPVRINPFSISTEAKIDLLMEADQAMARVKGVAVRQGRLTFLREEKHFANSEGAQTHQALYETGGGIEATAIDGDEVQRRSYPNSGGQQACAGYEFLDELDLAGHAERTADEAAALLTAAECPRDHRTTVILGGSQVALQVHESCGHPAELDRVYGSEAAYAGTSFLTPEKLGIYKYASPIVNLTADAVRPGGLGTFGWDDEGVAAVSTPVVRDGLFVGYLMSRETAAQLNQMSNGCMRASGWNRLPLIRMANVSLEPGHWSLDDLIADTDDGILMDTNHSWSIDDKRWNFQFGMEAGWEIKKGRLGRLLKNCTYTGITPEFWRSCDAICDARHWTMWGTPNCGKGQPQQIAHTGHGAAPARFRNVQVGVSA